VGKRGTRRRDLIGDEPLGLQPIILIGQDPSQRQLGRHIGEAANVYPKRKHTVARMSECGITRTMIYEDLLVITVIDID
jgi:hypothetical protein